MSEHLSVPSDWRQQRELRVSQAAVSRHIALLEKRLGGGTYDLASRMSDHAQPLTEAFRTWVVAEANRTAAAHS